MLAVLLLGCSRGMPDGGLEPELEEMPDRFVNLSIGRGGGGGQNEEMKPGDLTIIGGMLGNDDAKAAKGLVNAPSAATTAEAEPMRAQSAPADATPEAALRSWFPEAFLWRPSLQTDAQGSNPRVRPFMTGFLDPSNDSFSGRPAYLLQLPDGSLLVSDEQLGAIYRISYAK